MPPAMPPPDVQKKPPIENIQDLKSKPIPSNWDIQLEDQKEPFVISKTNTTNQILIKKEPRLEKILRNGANYLGLATTDTLLKNINIRTDPKARRAVELWQLRFKRWKDLGKNASVRRIFNQAIYKADFNLENTEPKWWQTSDYDNRDPLFFTFPSGPRGGFGLKKGQTIEDLKREDWLWGPHNLTDVNRLIRRMEASNDTARIAELYFFKGELEYVHKRFNAAKRSLSKVESKIGEQFWVPDYHYTSAKVYEALSKSSTAKKEIFKKFIWDYAKAIKSYAILSNLNRWDRETDARTQLYKNLNKKELRFINKEWVDVTSDVQKEVYAWMLDKDNATDMSPGPLYEKTIMSFYPFREWTREHMDKGSVFEGNKDFLRACIDSTMNIINNKANEYYLEAITSLGQLYLQSEKPAKARRLIEGLITQYDELRDAYTLRNILSVELFGWKKADFIMKTEIYDRNEHEAYLRIRAEERFRNSFPDMVDYDQQVISKIKQMVSDPTAFRLRAVPDSVDFFLRSLPKSENYMELYLKEEINKNITKFYPDSEAIRNFVASAPKKDLHSGEPIPKDELLHELNRFYQYLPAEKQNLIEDTYSEWFLSKEYTGSLKGGAWTKYSKVSTETAIAYLEAYRQMTYILEEKPAIGFQIFNFLSKYNSKRFNGSLSSEFDRINKLYQGGKIR